MMTAKPRSWWQKIKQHPFIVTGIIVVVLAVIAFIFAAYQFGWSGTGFLNKTLWDWLDLIAKLAIPAVVGLGAAWYTAQQGKVRDRENKDNQRENALQAYINNMSELLLKERLGEITPKGELKPEYRYSHIKWGTTTLNGGQG